MVTSLNDNEFIDLKGLIMFYFGLLGHHTVNKTISKSGYTFKEVQKRYSDFTGSRTRLGCRAEYALSKYWTVIRLKACSFFQHLLSLICQ